MGVEASNLIVKKKVASQLTWKGHSIGGLPPKQASLKGTRDFCGFTTVFCMFFLLETKKGGEFFSLRCMANWPSPTSKCIKINWSKRSWGCVHYQEKTPLVFKKKTFTLFTLFTMSMLQSILSSHRRALGYPQSIPLVSFLTSTTCNTAKYRLQCN